MTHYCVHVENGKYVVKASTDGRDCVPVATFNHPRIAAGYARMREENVQPLRSSHEGPPPLVAGSEELKGTSAV